LEYATIESIMMVAKALRGWAYGEIRSLWLS